MPNGKTLFVIQNNRRNHFIASWSIVIMFDDSSQDDFLRWLSYIQHGRCQQPATPSSLARCVRDL